MAKSEFSMEKNQNEELRKKFRDLHEKLVNEIITFCKENNITIDTFSLTADGVSPSIPYGQWCSCTDSCFRLDESLDRECNKSVMEMTDMEYKEAKINHKAFLLSI